VEFEWDEEKEAHNLSRHRVSFEEALTVFGDPFASTISDREHSEREERLITLGQSASHRLLIVCHTEWEERIRLISAREATRRERTEYETKG
jgi:uncharacterized DUF497 family protein